MDAVKYADLVNICIANIAEIKLTDRAYWLGNIEISLDCGHVERGSSVGRMPDSQSREPGFESPLLPFRSLGIFFHFTTPQSTQLYK